MDDIKINQADPAPENPENKTPETFSLGGDPSSPSGADDSKIVLDTTPLQPANEPQPVTQVAPAETTSEPQALPTAAAQPETPAATTEVQSVNGPAEQPAQEATTEQPAQEAAAEQLPQQEPLPPPSDALVEAATGIPQSEPEATAGMSKKKKIGLIVAGILVVIMAMGALIFFSGGSPFQGQVAPTDDLKFAPAVLCPTDYYAPKSGAYLQKHNLDLSIAKAQLLPFTEDGMTAVETTRDTVDMIDQSRVDGLSALDVDGTNDSPQTDAQPGILSESTTLEQEQPVPVGNLGDDAEVPLPVDIPEGCYPIPHDNLSPGNDQCGLIEQLFLDPAGYRVNEETKNHIDEWHTICKPPVAIETTDLCGENQVLSSAPVGAAPVCVCEEGYFDVSYALPDAVNPAVGAAINDAMIPTLACWNCDMLFSEIDRYKTLLESATTVDEKTILEEKISTYETVAERNGCARTEEVEELCGENEILNSDGVCVCANHYTKAAVADICIYDCESVIQKILDMRKSATTMADAATLQDLATLEEEAIVNGCEVPDEQTECEKYIEISNDAFNDRDYDLYYDYSKKYIDDNCSGETVTDCQKMLAKAVSVNRIIAAMTGAAAPPLKWEEELLRLRDEYYANPACNNTVDRCAELEAVYGEATGLPAPEDLTTGETLTDRIDMLDITDRITPSNVFNDDREYYETYCTLDEFSCEEIVANMTLEQVALLDIGAEELARYQACFTPETQELPGPTPMDAPTPTIIPPPDDTTLPPEPTPAPPPEPTPVPGPAPTPTPTPVPIVSPPPATSPPPPSVVSTSSEEATVQTEDATISLAEFSSPVEPSETVVEELDQVIEPEEPVHSAAPEEPTAPAPAPVYEEVPPTITPTGPETYIYLAGLLLGQLVFFRKRIFARMFTR